MTKPAKILVVDDNIENTYLLTWVLVQNGYHVQTVHDGQEALDVILEELPDLILLDIMMPDMDGYEVCVKLKADQYSQDIPVIIVSVMDQVLDKVKAFSVGAVDYITKPFQMEEVVARVETHLSLRKTQKQLEKEIELHKKTEEALRESEERFRLLSNAGFEGIIISDQGNIVDLNEQALKLFGGERSEILGQDIWNYVNLSIEDQGDGQIEAKYDQPFESLAMGKHGQPFQVEVQWAKIPYSGRMLDVTVIRDISKQRQAEKAEQEQKELAAVNERLKELAQIRTRLISDISHELRTPITNLSLYLDLLERGKKEKWPQYLAILREKTDQLAHLVEYILNISQLSSVKDKENPTIEDFNEIVEMVYIIQQENAEEANLNMTFDSSHRELLVRAEREQLVQVVSVIVRNAINYTPAGCVEISTGLNEEKQHVFLKVKDSGIGIEESDLPHIFELFYRGQQVSQLNKTGTGLELTLVREIVTLLDGEIEVESRVNKGSTFTVWLPWAEKENL